jgi:hypothetical protein
MHNFLILFITLIALTSTYALSPNINIEGTPNPGSNGNGYYLFSYMINTSNIVNDTLLYITDISINVVGYFEKSNVNLTRYINDTIIQLQPNLPNEILININVTNGYYYYLYKFKAVASTHNRFVLPISTFLAGRQSSQVYGTPTDITTYKNQ